MGRIDDPVVACGPTQLFAAYAEYVCLELLNVWFQDNPAAAEAARHALPGGTREVSYVERRARPPICRRYDVLLASGTAHNVRGSPRRCQERRCQREIIVLGHL